VWLKAIAEGIWCGAMGVVLGVIALGIMGCTQQCDGGNLAVGGGVCVTVS